MLQGGGLEAMKASPFERALVLEEGVTQLEDIPTTKNPSIVRIHDRFRFAKAGQSDDTPLDTTRDYEGNVANEVRAALRAQTGEQRDKTYVALYEPSYPGIRLVSPVTFTDDRDRNIIQVIASFALPNVWQTATDGRFRYKTTYRRGESFLNARGAPAGNRISPLRDTPSRSNTNTISISYCLSRYR